jgi:phosphoglycolate phosphatase
MTRPCLLFDLDGTLVDSLPDLTGAVNLLRADLGLGPLSQAKVRLCVGDGATLLVRRALPAESFSAEKLARFLDYYQQHLCERTRPYPGIPAMLAGLATYPLAVVTNKPERMAIRLLEELSLAGYFQVILGGDSCPTKKPHPAPLLKALQLLQGAPEKSLMIGDHHTDLGSAKAAGIAACFCTWGYGNPGDETPDFSVRSVTELGCLLATR